MEPQTSKSSEGRRRRTVFRKLRQLCNEFDMAAVVVLTDSMNRQWIYKSHDYVPAMRQARILEMTMKIAN
jgi:ABC-type enterochelin transport system ATPase subunit